MQWKLCLCKLGNVTGTRNDVVVTWENVFFSSSCWLGPTKKKMLFDVSMLTFGTWLLRMGGGTKSRLCFAFKVAYGTTMTNKERRNHALKEPLMTKTIFTINFIYMISRNFLHLYERFKGPVHQKRERKKKKKKKKESNKQVFYGKLVV